MRARDIGACIDPKVIPDHTIDDLGAGLILLLLESEELLVDSVTLVSVRERNRDRARALSSRIIRHYKPFFFTVIPLRERGVLTLPQLEIVAIPLT
jgi:hypothetical protein